MKTMGGPLLFIATIIGIALMFYFLRDKEGKIDIKYGVLALIWLIATYFAAITSLRFSALLVTAYALGIGAFFGILYKKGVEWMHKGIDLNKAIANNKLVGLRALVQSHSRKTCNI
jgi:asparagine N-glycosylation enzyme membrane subunit Stt3